MRTILSCLALTIIFCTDANGQIMIDAKRPDIIFSSSTISESGRVRLATLLQDSSVREEIQLLDSQKAELDKLTLAIGLANKVAKTHLAVGIIEQFLKSRTQFTWKFAQPAFVDQPNPDHIKNMNLILPAIADPFWPERKTSRKSLLGIIKTAV